MKKLYYIIMVIFLAGGFISCKENDLNQQKQYSFMFAENPVRIGAEGGDCEIMIIADTDYTPVSLENWITDLAKASEDLVTFKVSPNPEESSRDGKIAFHIDGTEDIKELTIRQSASEAGLKADKESISFNVTGGEEDIAVNSPNNWEIDKVSEWIDASKKNASALTIKVDVNYSGNRQTGEVTLRTATETLTITVVQENDNSLFHGAGTEMGRRFAYNSEGLVGTVTTDKSYSLTEGVNVLEIKYTGKVSGNTLPYYAYVFEIDLNKNIGILATCKDDDTANIKKTSKEVTGVQTMRAQFDAMENKRSGMNILGGINGDFFFGEGSATEDNSLLHGIMHKDGLCLKDTFDGGAVCTAFAIMKDGTARILSQTEYKNCNNEIQEAIGGRQEVLTSGTITSVKNNKYDPRTAIGVSADRKKVIMLVVDGRRSSHSNGAEYADLGKMLKAMGAYNGINLDGGGSSTFITKETAGFTVRNKPSNDVERAVVNGLAIIQK